MMLQWAFLIVPLLQGSSVSAFSVLSQSAIARRSSVLFTATFDPAVSTRTDVATQEESSSDQWLLESLEKEDRCVIGPKEVLVYDTTLRGTFIRCGHMRSSIPACDESDVEVLFILTLRRTPPSWTTSPSAV
jgi:hypothetical protein